MNSNKGQNIIEYILMAVAVILVFLVILNPQSGAFKSSIESTLYSTTTKIDQVTATINNLTFN